MMVVPELSHPLVLSLPRSESPHSQSSKRFSLRSLRLCLLLLALSISRGTSCFAAIPKLSAGNMSLRKNKSAPGSVVVKDPVTQRGGALSSQKLSRTAFDNGPFWQAQSVFLGANLLGYLISLITHGSHLHLDLLGTGAFAVAAIVLPLTTKGSLPGRVKLSTATVFVWGFKLASFLFYRALVVKHDTRLTDVRLSTFWVVSLLWGVLCSLPHTLGTTSPALGNPHLVRLGGVVYAVGLVIETLSDYQKWQFKKANPNQFCSVGLWSVSQHPNFFGNLLVWTGILIMNATALVGPQSMGPRRRYQRLAFACLSPLFMWSLFSGQAKGTMTNSAELANAKYGHDPAYQEYVSSVPLIIPNPSAFLR